MLSVFITTSPSLLASFHNESSDEIESYYLSVDMCLVDIDRQIREKGHSALGPDR